MKHDPNYHIDDLLVKSLLDETTLAEQIEINHWLSDNNESQHHYEHFELIWNQSKQLETHSKIDENAAWERFKKRSLTSAEETKVMPIYPKRSFSVLRIAAMVALTVCSGCLAYLFFHSNSRPEQFIVHSGNEIVVDTLPDGSVVTLNKRSTISYPAQFRDEKREVTLTGEAFFNVTPDKSKPFVIAVSDVTVKVLGTSFNVKQNRKKTEVIVETGLVEVVNKRKTMKLHPGEKATATIVDSRFFKEETKEEFHQYYRTGRLICDNTPLWRLAEILNEAFDADIVIENENIRHRTINTTFEQKSLDSILSVISETLAVKVEYHGRQIILK